MSSVYIKVNDLLNKFLDDISGNENNYVYELTTEFNGKSNTYRSYNKNLILSKSMEFAHYRNIYISPYCTRYPVGTSDYVFGRDMLYTHNIVIDIDQKIPLDTWKRSSWQKLLIENELLNIINKNNIPIPKYVVFSGMGFQLWYIYRDKLDEYNSRIIGSNLVSKLRKALKPKRNFVLVEDYKPFQQFRLPFTFNHKRNKFSGIVHINDNHYNYHGIDPDFDKEPYERCHLTEKRLEIRKCMCEVKEEMKEDNPDKVRKRFISGALSKTISIDEPISINEKYFLKIVKLLNFGNGFLSCKVAGQALGIGYPAASKFLRECTKLGYLKVIEQDDKLKQKNKFIRKARSYKICIKYSIKDNKNTNFALEYSKITGVGQSNKAMCRLARYAYMLRSMINKEEIFDEWIEKYYNLTSGNHSWRDLFDVFNHVYERFEKGKYVIY